MQEEMKKLKAAPSSGYPHEGIKSIETFPNRPTMDIVDQKVRMDVNLDYYPDFGTRDLSDFLLDRLYDYNTALHIAENQIRDMRAEYPFQPEDFKFSSTTLDNGRVVYMKNDYILTRVGRSNQWIFARHLDASQAMQVDLPNAQIAFFTLRALGVIKDEDFEGVEIIEAKLPVVPAGFASYEEYNEVERQRAVAARVVERNKRIGSSVAIYDDRSGKYKIPVSDDIPKRMHGRIIDTANFEWVKRPGDAGFEGEEGVYGG